MRRIIDDSDFEEEEEVSQSVDGNKGSIDEIAVSNPGEVISPLNSPGPTTAPRSVRKVIRQRDLELKESGTYDYDSDIYTEESSLGSFIVDSDEDEVQPSDDEGPG